LQAYANASYASKDGYGAKDAKDGYYPPGAKDAKSSGYYPPPGAAAKADSPYPSPALPVTANDSANATKARHLLALAEGFPDGYPADPYIASGFGSFISHRALLGAEDDKKDPDKCVAGTPFQKKYTECGWVARAWGAARHEWHEVSPACSLGCLQRAQPADGASCWLNRAAATGTRRAGGR
jgi:hypothetical protein